ncbi:hypothetical protein GCM10007216_28770 [Thalassobacillus devorans]|uniref:Uncharacterized protein n=1 Tax=Thalassobacillus devorans TaxID=279813 RepID=A0ABQ1PFU7_9BACI|nr:hypothetical protein GCM10007216_28770 [Thalassobacillus devorans]
MPRDGSSYFLLFTNLCFVTTIKGKNNITQIILYNFFNDNTPHGIIGVFGGALCEQLRRLRTENRRDANIYVFPV